MSDVKNNPTETNEISEIKEETNGNNLVVNEILKAETGKIKITVKEIANSENGNEKANDNGKGN